MTGNEIIEALKVCVNKTAVFVSYRLAITTVVAFFIGFLSFFVIK